MIMSTSLKRQHSDSDGISATTHRTQSHSPSPTHSQNSGASPSGAFRTTVRASSNIVVSVGRADVDATTEEEDLWAESCSRPAPFTNESICQRRRNAIDYAVQITKDVALAGAAGRPVRIYADGIYDMFHSGHARQLMQAKVIFPRVYLIVGVCNDALTYRMKGRTVMNETERYEAVRHCRYVDELVHDAPWSLDEAFLEKHKIDFVAHDDLPYGAGTEDDIYKWIKEAGRFIATQRTEGISTTDVITRIIRDYDVYVRRNLARGYTAKELNVGFMREKRLQFQNKVGAVKSRVDHVKERIAGKSHELLNKWEGMSREFVSNFVELFGPVNHWLRESGRKVARAMSPPPSSSRLVGNSSSSSGDNSPTSSPPLKRSRMRDHDDDAAEISSDEIGNDDDEDENDDEDDGEMFHHYSSVM